MKKLYALMAGIVTLLAMAAASSASIYFIYQPREPKRMK